MIFTNLNVLKPFVSEQGRIFSRRITGLTTKQQRNVKKKLNKHVSLVFFLFQKQKIKNRFFIFYKNGQNFDRSYKK